MGETWNLERKEKRKFELYCERSLSLLKNIFSYLYKWYSDRNKIVIPIDKNKRKKVFYCNVVTVCRHLMTNEATDDLKAKNKPNLFMETSSWIFLKNCRFAEFLRAIFFSTRKLLSRLKNDKSITLSNLDIALAVGRKS